MKFLRNCILFYLGGSAYFILELLWRGRSHGSMFLLGGTCFLLIGRISRLLRNIPIAMQLILSAGLVTALELLTGLMVNRGYQVWDYRRMPCNYRGQICLSYAMLWIPVSLLAILLYNTADRTLRHKL